MFNLRTAAITGVPVPDVIALMRIARIVMNRSSFVPVVWGRRALTAALPLFAALALSPARAQTPVNTAPPVIETGTPPVVPGDPTFSAGPPPATPDTRVPDTDQLPPDVRDAATRLRERGGARGNPTTAAGWKDYAEGYLQRGDMAKASQGFREASKIYAAKGDVGAAKVLEVRAQRYETQTKLFVARPVSKENLPAGLYTGKRLEPLYGAYIGAFIDREDGVNSYFRGVNSQIHKNTAEFDEKVGKRHATFFMYTRYGYTFPYAWFNHLKANGHAAQWVMQPANLDDVKDDEYLKDLAQEAARVGIPIFVRFAGEMNGDWVPYHGDPEKYKEKFRLVARVFHQYAPNVAMVWCPNEVPENKIPSYYPGEDVVDWVGVNFYSVYYNDNDATRPVNWRNPADQLDYVYRNYSGKHPILIGECAATHMSSADNVTRSDYAADKIAQLYAALPRRYPRIKAIHWFDMNAMKWAEPGRRLNNYALLEESKVRDAYLQAIADPYFLPQVQQAGQAIAPAQTVPLVAGDTVGGQVRLSGYVKTYEEHPTVRFMVGNKVVKTFKTPGRYDFVWDTTGTPNGPAEVTLEVRDEKGALAGTQTVAVKVDNSSASVAKSLTNAGALAEAVVTGAARPGAAPVVVVAENPTASPATPQPGKLTNSTAFSEDDGPAAPKIAANLGVLLGGATSDSTRLALTATPDSNRLTLGSRIRFDVRAQSDGYLFLTLLTPPSAGATDGEVSLLYPRGVSEPMAAAQAAKVSTGETVGVPKDTNKGLRPDAAGRFVIRAVLLPTLEAAHAYAQALTGTPKASELAARLRAARLTEAGNARGAVVSERTLEVVAPSP